MFKPLAGDTVLCSWARHFPLRTKVPCSYQGKHSCFSTVASQCPSSPRSVQMGTEEFNAGGSSAIFKHSLRGGEEILQHVHVFPYSLRPWIWGPFLERPGKLSGPVSHPLSSRKLYGCFSKLPLFSIPLIFPVTCPVSYGRS